MRRSVAQAAIFFCVRRLSLLLWCVSYGRRRVLSPALIRHAERGCRKERAWRKRPQIEAAPRMGRATIIDMTDTPTSRHVVAVVGAATAGSEIAHILAQRDAL